MLSIYTLKAILLLSYFTWETFQTIFSMTRNFRDAGLRVTSVLILVLLHNVPRNTKALMIMSNHKKCRNFDIKM